MTQKTSVEWARVLRQWAKGCKTMALSPEALLEISEYLKQLPEQPEGKRVGLWTLNDNTWSLYERPNGTLSVHRNDGIAPAYLPNNEADALSYIKQSMEMFANSHMPKGIR